MTNRRAGNRVERLAHIERITQPLFGQLDLGADPVEELKAEIALEQPQLVADRAPRKVEFVGCLPHRAVAGETVERPERLGRWNPLHGTS
jgi:hypothetical protein